MKTRIFTLFTVVCLLCVTVFAQQASDNAKPKGPDAYTSESRPDRLTDIPDDVSPIMVVATIAFKPEVMSGGSGQAGLSKEFGEMIEAMKRAKGFMGVRFLRSDDTAPMFVAVSWWKDRKSLVDWYYNPAHLKMVKSFHYGNGDSSKSIKDVIAHIGIQFYAPLSGGLSTGGKFGPTQKPVE